MHRSDNSTFIVGKLRFFYFQISSCRNGQCELSPGAIHADILLQHPH